ncbi:MAG TPA: hypothetical protein VJ993_01185 [Woeseiaceae bacterium]|nr:hypothetical protein [Woeseiaceae bacterium]
MKMLQILGATTIISLAALVTTDALAKDRTTGRGTGPVVYVESQGLFYDSIVLADLPAQGRFQQLKPGTGPSGLATEFGPGDTGYLGGRWWIDANGNDYMDEGDAFFLCPLLGPGRSVL